MAVIDVLVVAFIIAMVVQARAEYVTAPSGLRVREKPGTDAKILEVLPFRTQVFGEIEENWMRLEDRDGYVDATWLSTEDPCDGWTYLGNWHCTAYAATGNCTASGAWPEVGTTIATNALPFGSRVYIQNVGVRLVQDRGPAWLGNSWLDVYLGDYASCVAFGSRYLDVWLIPENENGNK